MWSAPRVIATSCDRPGWRRPSLVCAQRQKGTVRAGVLPDGAAVQHIDYRPAVVDERPENLCGGPDIRGRRRGRPGSRRSRHRPGTIADDGSISPDDGMARSMSFARGLSNARSSSGVSPIAAAAPAAMPTNSRRLPMCRPSRVHELQERERYPLGNFNDLMASRAEPTKPWPVADGAQRMAVIRRAHHTPPRTEPPRCLLRQDDSAAEPRSGLGEDSLEVVLDERVEWRGVGSRWR